MPNLEWLPDGIWRLAFWILSNFKKTYTLVKSIMSLCGPPPFNIQYELIWYYRKQATNRAHLTLMFYFLRWVAQFSNFGIWAHLILVLKIKMEILIEKSWPFHSCLYNCIGHWRLTTLTTNRAQSMFIQLLLHTWHWRPIF